MSVRVDPLGGAPDIGRAPIDGDGTSLFWAGLNKAKRSVELDLATESGRSVVRSMLAVPGPGFGIIVTNSVGQDWLTYEALRDCRPDLIHVHIGGRADGLAAVDYTVNPEVGLPSLTGPDASSSPVNHVLPAWDLLAGLHAAIAVLVADRVRRETGVGQSVKLALSDVAVATMGHLGFLANVVVNGAQRQRDGNYLYGSFGCDFATADGRRVMVVALTRRHWRNLVAVSGTGEVMTALAGALHADFEREHDRYQHRAVISAVLAPWFESREHDDVATALDAGRVLWGNYRTVAELVSEPDSLLGLSSIISDVLQPGVGTYPVPGPVLQLSESPIGPTAPAPSLGGDTEAVLTEWLGRSADQVAE